VSDYIQHTRPDGSTFYSNILKEIKSTASLPKQCGDVKQILNEPSKEATDHAHDICNKLHGSLKYWAETSIFVQLAINASTAPLEQRIRELEKACAEHFSTIRDQAAQLTTQQKALEFYGDEKNYNCDESLNDGYPLAGTQPVIKDYGAIARAAMGKEKA
jgi:hypothetical protein